MHDDVMLLTPRRIESKERPRLMLISYHFPPGQATGALRWQKLAGFAVERGWAVDVITRHPDELPSSDSGRLAQLPEHIRVFGVRSRPVAAQKFEKTLLGVLRKVRGAKSRAPAPAAPVVGNASSSPAPAKPAAPELVWRNELSWSFTPGGLRRAYHTWRYFGEEWAWAHAARDAAVDLFDGHKAIVSCGPPHVPHMAARAAAAKCGVPFVMDMRDPWSLAPAVTSALASPLWYRMAETYERDCVNSAALVVTNTGALARAMKSLYPQAANKILPVMNGCDDDNVPLQPRTKFTVCYAGNIYIDRDPRLLFRAFAGLVKATGVTPDKAMLELVGHVEQFGGASVRQMAADEGIAEYLSVHARLPRGQALELMGRAAVLVSLPQDVDVAIPSKIFEYMQFPSWILALAKNDSATGELLAGTTADVVMPDNLPEITRVLTQRYQQFSAGERPEPVNADGRFTRSRQAGILFDALDNICENTPKFRVEAA